MPAFIVKWSSFHGDLLFKVDPAKLVSCSTGSALRRLSTKAPTPTFLRYGHISRDTGRERRRAGGPGDSRRVRSRETGTRPGSIAKVRPMEHSRSGLLRAGDMVHLRPGTHDLPTRQLNKQATQTPINTLTRRGAGPLQRPHHRRAHRHPLGPLPSDGLQRLRGRVARRAL